MSGGYEPSQFWVTAIADGVVVRSETGIVVQDLDGDGLEQTGWAVLYLHIGKDGRPPVGTYISQGERVGLPSCEGGRATGTHVHLARKYNGEWIEADGSLPFVLSGWRVFAGSVPYQGTLVRGDRVVTACDCGAATSWITLEEEN